MKISKISQENKNSGDFQTLTTKEPDKRQVKIENGTQNCILD